MNPFPWLNGKAYKKIDGSQIVAKAREYIGTPWHHCGRKKGVGVDCAGLVVGVFMELGVVLSDCAHYTQSNNLEIVTECLGDDFVEVLGDWQAGDIALMNYGPVTNHLGVLAPVGEEWEVIHAWASETAPRVVSHNLSEKWRRRIYKVYRYGGCA